MTSRRQMLAIGAAAVAAPLAAFAQTQKPPRIIVIAGRAVHEGLRQGFQERGYTEGKTLLVEYRVWDGRMDNLPALVNEIVRSNPNVIVASGNPVIAALKKATQTIPVVMSSVADPVGSGFVAALARPGGNITGLSNLAEGITAKRLQILMEIRPQLARVAVLRKVDNATHAIFYREIEAAARTAKVTPVALDVRSADDFDESFRTMSRERAEALIVLPDPLIGGANGTTLIALAAKYKIPAIYATSQFVEEGGLVSYGASQTDLGRRAAGYADRILKGAKPAELPVEQAAKFDLWLNAKTAKALGITLPQALLLRAEKVIE